MTTPSSPAHHYLVYLPIGKLTTAQLKMGYIALKKIEELINKKIKGDTMATCHYQYIVVLTSSRASFCLTSAIVDMMGGRFIL